MKPLAQGLIYNECSINSSLWLVNPWRDRWPYESFPERYLPATSTLKQTMLGFSAFCWFSKYSEEESPDFLHLKTAFPGSIRILLGFPIFLLEHFTFLHKVSPSIVAIVKSSVWVWNPVRIPSFGKCTQNLLWRESKATLQDDLFYFYFFIKNKLIKLTNE